MTKTLRTAVLATITAICGTAALYGLSQLVGQHQKHEVWLYFLYEGLALCLTGLAVVTMWFITGRKLHFLRRGNMNAHATAIPLLRVTPQNRWRSIGVNFTIAIALLSGAYLVFTEWAQLPQVRFEAWVFALIAAIPLAALNSLNEEVITRWTISVGFSGDVAKYSPWVSAIIFGTLHFFGTPGGIIAALISGFLAWIAARSIRDTKGIGWAWTMHFVQDIVIFTLTIGLFF